MWCDLLKNNKKIQELYDVIPELLSVRIEEISILSEKKEIHIVFDMPRFFDNFPENKIKSKDNVAVIEVIFRQFYNLNISFDSSRFRGNILIRRSLEKKLVVNLEGNITCDFIAEHGEIKEIRTYIK